MPSGIEKAVGVKLVLTVMLLLPTFEFVKFQFGGHLQV